MWGNNCIGTDGGSEAWIPQQVQVCGDARSELLHGSDSTSSETEDVAGAVLRALDTCRTNHQFIASQAEHLQRLRSQCANSSLNTKQEIRNLEVKLVRLFGQQLACKRRLPVCAVLPSDLQAFPCLTQWLSVVGLSPDAIQAGCGGVDCLETLLGLADAEVCALLAPVAGAAWHTSKLQRALYHLRRYTAGQMKEPPEEVEAPLYWDSWEQHPQQRGSCPSSPRTLHKPSPHGGHREARSSVSSSDGDMSDMGGSFTNSGTLPSGGLNHHHHHHQHRSSDESSTPSSPPVMGLTHPHHHHHHHLHHYSTTGAVGNATNNVSPNKPMPPPSPLHPPSTPSLTLQLPPSSTPIHDLRYTPPTTPPVIKTPKPPDKKVSTPPPNKKFLLINTPGSGNVSSGSLGRSTSHESQLATRRAGEADTTTNCNTANTPTTSSHYPNNYVPSNSNSHSATTTPPHNANEMLIVSPNAANISHDPRHHSRHQSESSNDLPPYTPHSHERPSPASISGSHASLTQQAPPTSLASPTRHHYNHPHPYQQHTDDDNYNKNSSVPRSPRTPPLQGSMVHNVQHRFTKSINIKPATCGYCRQKFPILGGLRCKECNFKCHRECESKLPPSCGLPTEYLKIFTESVNNTLQNSNRGGGGVGGVSPSHQPDLHTPPLPPLHHAQHNQHTFQGPDSSSNTSSCNSSTPSSPALILPPPSPATLSSSSSSSNSGKHLHHQQQQHQQQMHHHHHHQHQQQQQQQQQQQHLQQQHAAVPPSAAPLHEAFHYPDVTKQRVTEAWGNFPMRGPPPSSTPSVIHSLTSTTSSTLSATSSTRSDLMDSDRTTISTNSGSGSTDDSERTVAERVDSQDSTISDGLVDSGGGGAAGDGGAGGTGGPVSGEGCSRQNSVSQGLREWDIPYDELDKGKIIGRGRFGTVYSGNWHGQVAIKELHMEYGNDQNTLEAFRSEVSMFRKTRHQNLVLFMGACMKLPRLAIITSLCKGNTLYKHIHVLRDKFTMSNTISIAQQVAQGMGYLHARGIVHKDLKSKNIFIENGKVVITDFGLVNVTRLCQNNRAGAWLSIPAGWLCYLSPELMRALQVSTHQPHSLPHTTTTDVYSYGTVWFELLCGEWPHKGLPPEAIIWQVGRGIKPSLAHLQASRDVKDILMECWSYRPDERPDFASLQKQLKKLPKKRLARSPSHPIHLSRSAECVF